MTQQRQRYLVHEVGEEIYICEDSEELTQRLLTIGYFTVAEIEVRVYPLGERVYPTMNMSIMEKPHHE